MKISLAWLREYVDYEGAVEALEELLTGVGFPVEEVRQVGSDWMLDVEVTSNRSDCLGHIGVAREVAAATGAAFRMPSVDFSEGGASVSERTSVTNEASDLCGRYTARLVEGVKVGPSPSWMVERLETVGLRGINNVVDITNYILMEVGQPLHAFDFARLAEGRIVVRRAKAGERMVTIDHSTVDLDESMLVIADGRSAVALAGIMGGLSSEVGDGTEAVLLESAHFDPLSIRSTSRSLGVSSESSFRFERDVDVEMAEWASRRAASLLAELAGGQVISGVVDSFPKKVDACRVRMRLSRLRSLVGIEIALEEVVGILGRLGFEPVYDGEEAVVCTVPSWRGDVTREVDLIEEVIRVHGYDKVPVRKEIAIRVVTQDRYQQSVGRATGALSGCGFYETVNVSFVEDRHWEALMGEGFEPVRVQDMSRRSNNALRPSLLASLLGVRKRNQDVGNGRCDLYELAAVHASGGAGAVPQERISLALCSDGDFWELRGVVEAVATSLNRKAQVSCEGAAVSWAASGTGARILVDGVAVGVMGRASERVVELFDLSDVVSLAELDFGQLNQLEPGEVGIVPLSRYPGVRRDLSLVIGESASWQEVVDVINGAGAAYLQATRFVGIYRGKGVASGKKSLTLSLDFRREDQTLTHEEVDAEQERLLAVLKEKLGATLRG